jgi:mono/diheme cytochrome c family protein
LTAGLGLGGLSANPVVPGLHGDHPLDETRRGELLIGELRCAACHEGLETDAMKEPPDLANVGSRLTPDFIKRFIADPAAAHPGTTMPAMHLGESDEERRATVESITAYLRSLDDGGAAEPPVADADPGDGGTLFHEIGCVACHAPRDASGNEIETRGAVPLDHLPGKYRPGELAAFLHAPLAVRPSGRMPDMKLTRDEAALLAAFLGGESTAAPEHPRINPAEVEAGRRAFVGAHCTACHRPEDDLPTLPPPGPAAADLDPTRGCLSEQPGAAPDFHLAESQRRAIRKALAAPARAADDSAAARANLHLTRMNCIACHQRDDFGGVSDSLNDYFHSTEEALGDEARIPPPLTMVGAKLRPEWLRSVLYDGLSVRPYMKTRMPQYGRAGLGDLAELLGDADEMEPVELPEPSREERPEMRDGALMLLGDKGLNCIACHNYNGKESPGMKGLDIMTSYQRLQPAWFYQFMREPGKFRPGIIMPSYWPQGEAVQTEILGGDGHRQLRALWHHFSLGRSARDPSGLQSRPSILEVTDAPRTYRGRSNVAGYRGIAVGFPEEIHYAFNAQNGALAAVWSGEFVRVGWQGQGSGNFNPIGQTVQLAQDVAFLHRPDPDAPWPLRPRTTKEQPVNPDPLYPRNHGYQFLGYALDEDRVPTFRYRCGPVEIRDRTRATAESGGKRLRREFFFSAPGARTVWFRALTGDIRRLSETEFETPEIRISVAPAATELRTFSPAGGDGEARELLIKLPLPEGESTYHLEYELLR